MRPHALKQTCLAVAQAVIIAVCLSAPASAQIASPTPSPTPTAASLSIRLERMANHAKNLLPIIRNEIEGPLLPWLENLSLVVAVLVMFAAFARLWRENAGAGVDLFWWFARLGVIFALLGGGPRIIDGMYTTGREIAEGKQVSGGTVYPTVLYRFYIDQRIAFDHAYQKFTEGAFTVKGVNVTSSGVTMLGVLRSDQTSVPGFFDKLDAISTSMPALLDSMNFSRAVISFGDLFLMLLSSFLLIVMRLAAPVMIALAIDRSLAQRVTYPYLWGVVVLTLIWPIVVLIIKSIAYTVGNVAMVLGADSVFYKFDETTMGIIKNGDPVFTILFAAVTMLIAGISLWVSPYIAYQLSFGGVYETVSQTISGWAGYFKTGVLSEGMTKYTEGMRDAIAGRSVAGQSGERQASIASGGATTQGAPAGGSSRDRVIRFTRMFGSPGRFTGGKINAQTSQVIPGQNDLTGSGQSAGRGVETVEASAKRVIERGGNSQF